ncbi:unnamed protein product [Ectocarpus sp. 6 AP-2014]
MVRLLHVTIFEGVGVAPHKEPYACAELLDITGRPIKKERVKTKTVTPGSKLVWGEESPSPSSNSRGRGGRASGGRSPVRGALGSGETKREEDGAPSSGGVSLTLGRKHDLRNVGALPVLRLSLWGREVLSKDKPLGVALLDLASLPRDGGSVESWQALEPATGMDADMACGSLRVSVRLDEEEANRIFYAGAAGPEGEGEGYVVGIEDGPGDEDEEYAESDPNLLVVKVRRGRGLKGLDVDLMGEASSDPFVKLTTITVEKNLAPEWEEVFEFAVKDFTRRLEVEVLDADVVVDEAMGAFVIKLEDLLHKRRRTLGFHDHSSDTSEGEEEENEPLNRKKSKSKVKAKMRDKAEQAREAEKKAMHQELMDIEVKSGDYTIYVHIIEARDLKAEDLQGTSDPVVYVEAFGQKYATEVKEACLSCVFDETFVIGLRNLDKDEFEEGVIRISVMDADGPVAIKNDLIGSYSFDASNVYFHKDHEIHRQWVALVDDENPKDSGTQGYLQLSIAIVGPGDKLKARRDGGVTVSGGAPAQTKTKSMYGTRSSMAPNWRTQLWVPVSIPSMSGSVKTVVKDWDSMTEDETVASVNCKLKEIEGLPDRRHGPRWFPLYGAPLVIPTSTDIAEIAKRMAAGEATTNWRTLYDSLPQKGSTYRGRLLLSREIRESLPIGREEVGRLPKRKEPSTTRVAMRCYVATGADLPCQASVIRMGLNFRMSVRISIGSEVLETRAVENASGVCEWGELLESKEPVVLPSDPDQMPDAIVHLQRGEDKVPICFFRIPAKELLEKGMEGISPRWLLLGEDKVLDCLPPGQYPGSVLIKLGLGTLRQFSESAAEWQAEALKLRNRTSYLLRVHIYQGRDLPAADDNGLMDPFLKMQCQGEKLNTEEFMYLGKAVHRRRETVDPMWYFTWEADLNLPSVELQRYFPQVSIQLMDWDPLDPNDYAGCMFLDLGSCPIEMDQANIPYPPLPTWMPFFLEKPGDSSGELLVSYQLIKTTRPGLSLAPPPDLTPKLKPAYLEILALGIRGMQPFEMLPMQMPYMQMEASVDLPHGKKVSLTTNPSKKPSGADANFLERLKVPLDLPVNEIFAPRLKLCVRDVRLGGSGPVNDMANPMAGAGKKGNGRGRKTAAVAGVEVEVPAPEAGIVEVMGQEDEGAGVFGAILHEPVVREKVWSAARGARGANGEDEDEDDGEMSVSSKEHPDYLFVSAQILNELLLPKGYKLRLYCLQALNLTPMDIGIGGRPGKSDPYLKVKLGKEVFSDVDNYIDDVTDADLYRCVELNCELPGASQLQIDVMDYDDIGGDELIGRTVIDLEDRWFDQRWQDMGMEHRAEDLNTPDKMRWQVKPLENRSLYVPTSNAPQGMLQCWVDIMPPGDAKGFPPADVALPPDVEFEVRLVIWKCKDVVAMDFASGLNDLFVKSWLEGCDPLETDTHWRAKGGKGSFNWRMKFRVILGPRARSSKFPYLTLQASPQQMWDKDLLWNDCIAEGMLDLGKHFRRAYKKKNEVLKLFESEQTERAKEAIVKTQQALKSEQAKALKYELQTGIPNPLLGDIEDDQPVSPISADAEIGSGRPGNRAAANAEEDRRGGGGGWCCFGGKKPMTQLELRAENDRRRTLGMPLLDEEEGLTAKEARERRKEEGDEEVKELIQKLKVMAGISNDDPPDSQWISLEKTDRKTGKKTPMGKCLIGIQIYPLDKAEAQPAGLGRAEPNDSPFLPPPNGRLQFGWNPISMISQLLGPRLCAILCCFLCCGIIITSLIVFQPLWNLLIALAFNN